MFFRSNVYAQELDLELIMSQANETSNEEVLQIEELYSTSITKGFDFKNASADDYRIFPFLSEVHIAVIKNYLSLWGPLQSKFEILAIDSLPKNIKNTLINIKEQDRKLKVSLSEVFTMNTSKHLISKTINWKNDQQKMSIYNKNETYVGSPMQNYFRYTFTANENLSGALIYEKDIGEKAIQNSFPYLEFLKPHILYKNGGVLEKLIVGAYTINYGLGLCFQQNNAFSNLSFNSLNDFLPDRSRTESFGQFGIASRFNLNFLFLDLNISSKLLDANLNEDGSAFSSLYSSGLHRTNSELEKKNALMENSFSAIVKRRNHGLYFKYLKYSKPFRPKQNIWNKKKVTGFEQHYQGWYYQKSWNGLFLNGEISFLNLRSIAFKQSVVFIPTSKTTFWLSLEQPHSSISNKSNFFFQTDVQFRKDLVFQFIHRLRKYNWLQYQEDYMGKQSYYSFSILYKQKRSSELLFKYWLNNSVEFMRNSCRLQYQFETKTWRFKTRIEFNSIQQKNAISNKQQIGALLFNDLLYKFRKPRLKVYLRYSIFNLEGSNNRFSTYENNVLYSYSLNSLFHSGDRKNILLVYSPSRKYRISFRWIQSRNYNGLNSTISNINGRPIGRQNEYTIQIKYQW